jgi:hypothetical protein
MNATAAPKRRKRAPGPTLPTLALILGALILLAEGVGAATVPWIDLEEMATRAEVVALGRVEKVRSAWTPDARMIVTTATIEIEKGLKGGPRRRVSIRVPGGRVGDQIMVASGAPTFEEGERLVVFLERPGAAPSGGGAVDRHDAAPGTPFSIVGWNLGKMSVRRDPRTGRDLVHDASGDWVTYIGPDGRPIDRTRARRGPEEVGQFLQRVEAILEKTAKRPAQ